MFWPHIEHVQRDWLDSEISPRHSSSEKYRCVHMGSQAGQVTELSDLSNCDEKKKNSLMYTPARVNGEKLLDKIAALLHYSGQTGVMFALHVFPLQKYANYLNGLSYTKLT